MKEYVSAFATGHKTRWFWHTSEGRSSDSGEKKWIDQPALLTQEISSRSGSFSTKTSKPPERCSKRNPKDSEFEARVPRSRKGFAACSRPDSHFRNTFAHFDVRLGL